MNVEMFSRQKWLPLSAAFIMGTCAIGSYSTAALAVDVKVTLKGDQEVPPVKTVGTGSGFFAIGNDKSVNGSVNTAGIAGTAAHIHVAAPGANGPVIIPLTKNGDTYKVPAGTKFTAAQSAAFQAGKLYVNVHTAANPGGEVRGQLKP